MIVQFNIPLYICTHNFYLQCRECNTKIIESALRRIKFLILSINFHVKLYMQHHFLLFVPHQKILFLFSHFLQKENPRSFNSVQDDFLFKAQIILVG